jgi:hypothetical protein
LFVAILWLLHGFFIPPPFFTPLLPPFQTNTRKKIIKDKGKRGNVLIRGIEFFGASLIFAIRISNFFLLLLLLLLLFFSFLFFFFNQFSETSQTAFYMETTSKQIKVEANKYPNNSTSVNMENMNRR